MTLDRSVLTEVLFQREPRVRLGGPETSRLATTPCHIGPLCKEQHRSHSGHYSQQCPVSTSFCNNNRNFDSVPSKASCQVVPTSSQGPATARPHSAALNDIPRPIREDLQQYQPTLQQQLQRRPTFSLHTKYPFQIKRILLTRDHPRDHSVPPNGKLDWQNTKSGLFWQRATALGGDPEVAFGIDPVTRVLVGVPLFVFCQLSLSCVLAFT